MDALDKASGKMLANPGGYCLTVIRNLKPEKSIKQDDELSDWEKQWLEEMHTRLEENHAE